MPSTDKIWGGIVESAARAHSWAMSEQATVLEQIAVRRKEIAERRTLIAEQINELKKLDCVLDEEESELAITERNVRKFVGGEIARAIGELTANAIAEFAKNQGAGRGKRKPDGLPSVLSMAGTVLIERAEQGRGWLEPAEIVTEIKKRWWPEAEVEFISPQLWRAAKRGSLQKDGTRYAVPQRNEKAPDGVAAEASQSNGAAGSSPVST